MQKIFTFTAWLADEFNADGSVNWSRQWGKDIYDFAQKMNLNKFHYFGKCHGTAPGWYLVKNHPEILKSFACFFLTPHVCKQNSNQWFELLKDGDPAAMMKAAMRKPETDMKIKMEEMASVGKTFSALKIYFFKTILTAVSTR